LLPPLPPLLLLLLQATSRIWRYGQAKPCFGYHLLYAGSVEEALYSSALAKQKLFERVRKHALEGCVLH
jgi:SNF2 family DNA or RNA helicase